MKIADGILCPHQNVRTRKKDHRLIFGENLLYAVEGSFSLLVARRSELLLHQAVDFRFPRCPGMRLRRVPKVRAAPGEPNVEIGSWVGIEADQPQHASIVLLRL